jgi:hypothetical protein
MYDLKWSEKYIAEDACLEPFSDNILDTFIDLIMFDCDSKFFFQL